MRVTAEIQLCNILDALDLADPPEGCILGRDETVMVEGCEIDDDDAIEKLDLDDDDPAIDPDGLQDLSAAIRSGNRVEAEHLLDRLFAESPSLTERIQRGRYSRASRCAAEAAKIAWG